MKNRTQTRAKARGYPDGQGALGRRSLQAASLRYLLPVGVAILFVSAAHLHAAGVSIKVLNGSNLPGYARQAGEFLKKKGYRVDRVDSAEKSFLVTTTYFKPHAKDAAKEVSGLLPGPQEIKPLSWESIFDIIVVMGSKGADPSALRSGEPTPAAQTLRQSEPLRRSEPPTPPRTAPSAPAPSPPSADQSPQAREEDFETPLSEDAEPTPPPMEDTAPAPRSAAPSETDDEFSSLAFDDEEPQEKPVPLEESEEIKIEPEAKPPAPVTKPTPVAKPQPKPVAPPAKPTPAAKPAPGKVELPKPAAKPATAGKPRPVAVPRPEQPKPPPKVSGADYMEIAAADLVKQAGEVLGKFVKVEDAFLDQSNYFLGMRQFEIGPNEFVEFFSGKSRVNLIIYVPKSNGAAVSVLKGLSRGDNLTIYGKVLAKNPIGRPLLIADRLEKL